MKNTGFLVSGIVFIVISLVPLYFGFHRMFMYDSEDFLNVHVGNDQGNFMINGLHAIAFFVLSGISFLGGLIQTSVYQLGKK